MSGPNLQRTEELRRVSDLVWMLGAARSDAHLVERDALFRSDFNPNSRWLVMQSARMQWRVLMQVTEITDNHDSKRRKSMY